MQSEKSSIASIQTGVHHDPAAVALARAHMDAWSHHDWDRAREMLAHNVHVMATTTQPIMAATDLTGVESYMDGLIKFAQPIEPGSAQVLASTGDEHNSLILLSVRAAFGPGGEMVTLRSARLAMWDDDHKMIAERVIFFVLAA